MPGRVTVLHRAAAAWHAERGLADDAVRHAVAAGDHEQAAVLIEQHFDAAYFTGENATVQRWLSGLPTGAARSRPRLALARAFLALTAGDVAAAEVGHWTGGNGAWAAIVLIIENGTALA